MAYSGSTTTISLGSFGLLTDIPSGDLPRGALIKACLLYTSDAADE